ncbi:MAG: GGDEF domain-containing protein [Actinomycetes bacterium]
MGRVPKDPGDRPGKVVRLPSAGAPLERIVADAVPDSVAQDSSAPDVLDLRAQERDLAALARDRAAAARAARLENVYDPEQVQADRMLAARDRAAAALDREEAALDRHRAAEYLKRTYRDELTGALQREAGRDQLAHEVDRAHRLGDGVVIAFLDVVHLKQVNDEQGHAAGDAVLRAVGEALQGGLRSYDVVVRYGGDEFVCALPRASLAIAGQRFADVSNLLDAAIPGTSISVGLAELTKDETLDGVVGRADRELYAARRLSADQLADRRPNADD